MRISIIVSSIASKPINRTANARRSVVEDMGIDHRRLDGQMGQERIDLRLSHFGWVAYVMEVNESLDPVPVGLLRATPIMPGPQGFAQAVQ
jgi:hypothetical protein